MAKERHKNKSPLAAFFSFSPKEGGACIEPIIEPRRSIPLATSCLQRSCADQETTPETKDRDSGPRNGRALSNGYLPSSRLFLIRDWFHNETEGRIGAKDTHRFTSSTNLLLFQSLSRAHSPHRAAVTVFVPMTTSPISSSWRQPLTSRQKTEIAGHEMVGPCQTDIFQAVGSFLSETGSTMRQKEG